MINPIAASVAAAISLAGAGWGAHEYLTHTYAERESVKVVELQAQFVLDQQIESIVKAIAHLERKRNKTPGEIEQLRYLREQLQIMRRVRLGR